MTEEVILVDENDAVLGLMEKMEAHEKGVLHRAFSVFVLNAKNELLLQQRALTKYHSGGLWTNTCCSHPRNGEDTLAAAHRRLQEEMGFDCEMVKLLDFIYRAELDKGLIEHEFDHVFVGRWEGIPKINKEEVADYAWLDVDVLENDMQQHPEKYTAWFKIIYQKFLSHVRHEGNNK